MKKKQFSTTIKAPKEKVWKVLWDDTTYRKWTSVFSPDSHAESGWGEGDKVLFLDGKGSGMYSTIARKIPNEFMSFKHLGVIKEGKEQPIDEDTKKWSGATENYSLKQTDGQTELVVEVDVIDEFDDMMSKAFPEGLKLVKEMSEN